MAESKTGETKTEVEKTKTEMTKNSDAADFNRLKRDGFEFEDPQDELSYQSDSSGLMGGIIGKQEYGIDTDTDSNERTTATDLLADEDNPVVQVPGESQWSQDNRRSVEDRLDDAKSIRLTDSKLMTLARDRLTKHPRLVDLKIEIEVKNSEVTLRGNTPSISSKLLAGEIVSALPGVAAVHDEIRVEGTLP